MKTHSTYYAMLPGIAVSFIIISIIWISTNNFLQKTIAQVVSKEFAPQVMKGHSYKLQGTVSSTTSPLAGRVRDQVAVILPPMKDGGIYTGVITFTASKSVQPEVWNQLNVNASTPIPRTFGTISIAPSPTGNITIVLIGTPSTSNSFPFTGNALALYGRAPFIATYTVTGAFATGKNVNNLSSATSAATSGGNITKAR